MANNTLAYGFVELAGLMNERISDVGVDRVFDAIRTSVGEYNRQVNSMMADLVRRTTEYKTRYMQPGSGTLQPLNEDGNPLPVREEGYYDVAFPIQGGGTAFGANRVSANLMTVEEANRRTLNSIQRDKDWLRRHMLAALFDNVSWTYSDDLHGSLTVEPLANGDGTEFLKTSGSAADDDHYLAQASSIDDSNNPFDDIYDELMEHPVNEGSDIVVYTPTNLKSSIQNLTGFTEVGDPDLRYGVNTDQVATAFGASFGHEVLGKVDKCWIVEWKNLPDSYLFGHARGTAPVLWMREYDSATLQGFFTEEIDIDGNHKGMRYLRFCGFGVANRLGALVYRIGNGSYAIPSGYDAPLAV